MFCFRSICRKRKVSRSHSRGQALAFMLVFAAATGLITLLLFNSAKMANVKTHLQNAADAGAYSAAVLQSRDHNFSAYTNRAMIANQVAVAQFVSLKSYVEDAKKTQDRAKGGWLSFWASFPTSKPAWDAGKKIPVATAKSFIDGIAPKAIVGLDLLVAALEKSQQVHHLGTMTEMMFVADEVVKKNDPQAKISTGAFMVGDAAVRVTNWGNKYTQQHPATVNTKESDRFADVVLHDESQDSFTRNRISVPPPTPFWASSVKFLWCPLAAKTSTAFAFYHGGGTILSEDKKRWLGLDATMGGGFVSCTWIYPCPVGVCSTTITLPIVDIDFGGDSILGGSGGAVAGRSGGYNNEAAGYKGNDWSSRLYGYSLVSPAALPALMRFYAKGPGQTLDAKGGLQDYYRDMADPLNASLKPKDQTAAENGGKFPITVEVERSEDSLQLSNKLFAGSSSLRVDPQAKGNTVRTVASAHAYFFRPKLDNASQFNRSGWKRADGKTELANLFSPYWQASLTDTPAFEAAASAAAQK